MNATLRLTTIATLAAAALAAHAATLDFNDLPNQESGNFTLYGTSLSQDGFTLSTSTNPYDNDHLASVTPVNDLGLNYTGSTAILAFNSGPLTLTRSDGGAFDLLSMDIANMVSGSDFQPVTFTGRRADGSTVSQTCSSFGGDSPHRYAFTGFTDLTSVDWHQGPYYASQQFDNIEAQPVPEPGSFAALGVGAVSLLRRRLHKGA